MMTINGAHPGTGYTVIWTVPTANATTHASETAELLLANYPHAPFAAVYREHPPAAAGACAPKTHGRT